MFNKSLIAKDIPVDTGVWPTDFEYSNFLLNEAAVELLCGSKISSFHYDLFYKIDWQKLEPDYNKIIRALYKVKPEFEGYIMNKHWCTEKELYNLLKNDNRHQKRDVKYAKKYPQYSMEMYKPTARLEDID
jgi:hypothetical protein